MTKNGKLILAIIEASRDHLTADEVFIKAKEKNDKKNITFCGPGHSRRNRRVRPGKGNLRLQFMAMDRIFHPARTRLYHRRRNASRKQIG